MEGTATDLERLWIELEYQRLGALDPAERQRLAALQDPLEQQLVALGEPTGLRKGSFPSTTATGAQPRIVVVGGGVGGVCFGVRLRERGYQDFVILEKSGDVGGTWHHNNYPGVACDVASYFYSYSFRPNPNWTQMFAPGSEIKQYLNDIVDDFGLRDRVQLNAEVTSCTWRGGQWHLMLKDGRELVADILLLAAGFLHIPKLPTFPGQENFTGRIMHSTEWSADFDATGKRIGVIGTGSTSVQIVSSLSDKAENITVFQRTPQWIFPAENDHYSLRRREMLARHPILLQHLYDYYMRVYNEGFGRGAVGDKDAQQPFADACGANLASVADPELRRKLTPDYPIFCKRLVFSGGFYKALQRDNATLVTDGITQFERDGVRTADGTLHKLDMVVVATGFEAMAYFRKLNISVEGGPNVTETWKEGARSFDTIAMAGFPNLFFLGGPYSTVGNFSVMSAFEFQSTHIMNLLEMAQRAGHKAIMPLKHREDAFLARMRETEGQTAWLQGCDSWYLDEHGHVAIWTTTPEEFIAHLAREPDLADYEVVR